MEYGWQDVVSHNDSLRICVTRALLDLGNSKSVFQQLKPFQCVKEWSFPSYSSWIKEHTHYSSYISRHTGPGLWVMRWLYLWYLHTPLVCWISTRIRYTFGPIYHEYSLQNGNNQIISIMVGFVEMFTDKDEIDMILIFISVTWVIRLDANQLIIDCFFCLF